MTTNDIMMVLNEITFILNLVLIVVVIGGFVTFRLRQTDQEISAMIKLELMKHRDAEDTNGQRNQ